MIRREELSNYSSRIQKSISSNYTVTDRDEILYVDCTNGNVTITLPDAIAFKNFNLQVKKIDSTANTITLSPSNSQKIDQATSMLIYNQNDLIEINSDGTQWQTLSLPSSITNAPFALTPGATITLDPAVVGQMGVLTLTPAQNETINAPTLVPNQRLVLVITTSGTTSFTITFVTNFKSTGTLATGTVSGKVFVIEFVCDGVNYNEVARTVAM